MPRPCPFVGCRYNLYLDVNPKTGHIRYNFPQRHVCQMDESCALDIAECGRLTDAAIAEILGLERSTVTKAVTRALKKMKKKFTSVA